MEQPASFHQLSDAISAAAADPAQWTTFLQKLAGAVDGNYVALHWETMDVARRGKIAFKYGLAASVTTEYERYYGPRNPTITLAQARGLIAPGRAVLREEACSDSTFRSSEFYNDFLKPNDMENILGGTVAVRGPDICLMTVGGSRKRDPFTKREAHLLESLFPHMRTALILHDRLAAAEERLLSVETAFNKIPDAVVLVDSEAVILAANEAARKLLAARDGIYVEQDRLRIGNRKLEAKCSRILKGITLAKRFHLPAPQGGALRLPRPSGLPGWALQIFPVENKIAAAVAAIFITTSGKTGAPSQSDLAELFDLSPTQSEIALRLFDGATPNEIADRLGITRNTLKTHLSRLFLKLGITRQTELMRLLAKLRPR